MITWTKEPACGGSTQHVAVLDGLVIASVSRDGKTAPWLVYAPVLQKVVAVCQSLAQAKRYVETTESLTASDFPAPTPQTADPSDA